MVRAQWYTERRKSRLIRIVACFIRAEYKTCCVVLYRGQTSRRLSPLYIITTSTVMTRIVAHMMGTEKGDCGTQGFLP